MAEWCSEGAYNLLQLTGHSGLFLNGIYTQFWPDGPVSSEELVLLVLSQHECSNGTPCTACFRCYIYNRLYMRTVEMTYSHQAFMDRTLRRCGNGNQYNNCNLPSSSAPIVACQAFIDRTRSPRGHLVSTGSPCENIFFKI
jgi:hypothetical protein